jgi:hypothetical protein
LVRKVELKCTRKQQENSWNGVDQIINTSLLLLERRPCPQAFASGFQSPNVKLNMICWPKYSVALKYTSKPKPSRPYVHYESITIRSHIFIDN